MTTLENFIKAIRKEPKNADLRAVFADFLEEQGDSRAVDVRKTVGAEPFKWKSLVSDNYFWADYTLNEKELEGEIDNSEIPKTLFACLFGPKHVDHDGLSKMYSSQRLAWSEFGKAFAKWFGVDTK